MGFDNLEVGVEQEPDDEGSTAQSSTLLGPVSRGNTFTRDSAAGL
jgi:hypothetical protein